MSCAVMKTAGRYHAPGGYHCGMSGRPSQTLGLVLFTVGPAAAVFGTRLLSQPPTTVACDRASGHCQFVEHFWLGVGTSNQWMPITELHDSRMVRGDRPTLYQWRVSWSDNDDIVLTDWLDEADGIGTIESEAIALDHF